MRGVALVWALAALVGCGGDSGLSRDVVTSLPDGNATGTALSGQYRVTITTTSCAGACPSFQVLGVFTYSICKVGDVDSNETITTTQTDGHLEVVGDSSLFVQRLVGGVDADGAFDIGGYEAQGEGQVDVTARARGSISQSGLLQATAQARGVGSAEGKSINCVGSYTLSGQRQ